MISIGLMLKSNPTAGLDGYTAAGGMTPSLVLDFKNGVYASDTAAWLTPLVQDGVEPSLALMFKDAHYASDAKAWLLPLRIDQTLPTLVIQPTTSIYGSA